MRIAQLATLSTPVRRDCEGSVEQLVWLISRELTKLGHEVTVFGARGSDVPGAFVETMSGSYARDQVPSDWRTCEWVSAARAIERSHQFDLLHSHSYLFTIPLEPFARCPIVHTTHVRPSLDDVSMRRMYPDARVTAISASQWAHLPSCGDTPVVLNGIDADAFTFRERPDSDRYVLYLGRFHKPKGVLEAIDAARRAKVPIVLAGSESEYFREHIAHHVDGKSVRYVGAVHGDSRNRLLGGASALLFPVQEAEPFGLVMVEAMMCGTPAVATALGAVPEIVDDGISGCIAHGADELPAKIAEAFALDRRQVHALAKRRFTASRMAAEYAALYERYLSEFVP